ncbi:MAG: hypothetical protein IPL78_29195 [Chloroflexi bacterium]|nr:hypothetical protein [Chloroflexota bacterium]
MAPGVESSADVATIAHQEFSQLPGYLTQDQRRTTNSCLLFVLRHWSLVLQHYVFSA